MPGFLRPNRSEMTGGWWNMLERRLSAAGIVVVAF